MRRLFFTCLIAAVLALPASAFATDATVSIQDTAYVDSASGNSTSTITPGGTVTWTYDNAVPHGVQFVGEPNPTCGSNVLLTAPCPRSFPTAGRFQYYDPNNTGMTGTVIVDGPPVAVGTAASTAKRGDVVTFDGSASSDPDGDTITSYQWDFHDGTAPVSSAQPQVQHAFTTAGHYDVTLTVADSTGSGSTTVPIDITVPDTDGDGVNDDSDQCPTTPGPPPDGCPLTPPSPVPPRIASSATAAPELGVSGALRYGITTVFSCSGTCNGVFTLTRNGKLVSVPTTTALTSAGTKLVTVRFTSAARRSLAHVKNPRLSMAVVVTDAVGRTQTKRRTVVLKPVKTYGRLPAIGISDNNPTTFSDPKFEVLRLRYGRLVEPWNGIFTEPARLDGWLQAARATGIRPLISFEHTRGMNCPGRRCKAPSKAQYTRAWKAFHKKYPWVKDISPWNEVNSATQPTGTSPTTAATYYNIVRANCRGCTIVAADLLDAPNISRYASAFMAAAHRRPRLWGLHNYTDTNRVRAVGTAALLGTVPGTVWLTETGGVVRFVTQSGKVALPKSESRAARAMDYMFRLAEQNSHRIKRIYVYQWKVNNVFDRFDAGVVRPNGTARPSYDVLTLNASIAARR